MSSSSKDKAIAQQGSPGTYLWLYWYLCLLPRILSRMWHANFFLFLIFFFLINQHCDRVAACKAGVMLFCGQNRGALVLSCHLLKLPSTFWVKTVRQQQILGWLFRLGADEQPFLSLGLVNSFYSTERQVLGHLSLFLWKMCACFLGLSNGTYGSWIPSFIRSWKLCPPETIN